jgi:hypothetical protein
MLSLSSISKSTAVQRVLSARPAAAMETLESLIPVFSSSWAFTLLTTFATSSFLQSVRQS